MFVYMFVYVCVCIYIYMYKIWSLVLTPQKEKRKEDFNIAEVKRATLNLWSQYDISGQELQTLYFICIKEENNKTASTLAHTEAETTSRPVCNLYPTVSPAHLLDRT